MRWCRAAAWAALWFLAPALAAQDSLADLETRAGQAFDKRDCATASTLYRSALEPAKAAGKWTQAALYLRRIGICANRNGNVEDAYSAYHAGVEAAQQAKDPEMERENLHGLAVALRHMGRHTEALAAAERALELAKACGHPAHFTPELSEVAILYGDIGQVARAQQLYEELLEYARRHHDKPAELLALEDLGMLYGFLGQPDTGIAMLRQTLAGNAPDDHGGFSRLYTNIGALYKAAGRLKEAKESSETALRYLDAPEAWRNRVALLFNLGDIELELGNLPGAAKYMEEALKAAGAGRDPELEAETRATLSTILLKLGKPAEARQTAEEAVPMARKAEVPTAVFISLSALGEVYDLTGDPDKAGPLLDEACALVEASRLTAPGDPTGLTAFLKRSYTVYQLQVEHLIRTHQPEAALLWAEKSKARVLNDLLLRGHLDERSAMSGDELHTEQTLLAKVSQSSADRKKSQAAIDDLELFRRQLYSRHPELALQRADFAPAGMDEIRKLLPGPHSALLEYFELESGMALFVVSPKGIVALRLGLNAGRMAEQTARLREQLAARDVNYSATARALYAKLIGPAAEALAGTTRWIVSPEGPLWGLPFQALMDGRGKYLLETHAIDYTPSLTALGAIRQRHAHDAPAPLQLLALGNPVNRAGALPDAEEEVRGIGRLYPRAGQMVLTGGEARQDLFRQQAPRAAVIHIATHAELNTFNPMYSTLLLSPGKGQPGALAAGEMLRIPLRADVVILSACETARGATPKGEELLGMGWALTGAGAASSVISQWKVDSAATSQLMVAFHRSLRQSQPPAEALRRAALEVMNTPGRHNPFYWAAFLVLGDGFR